MHVFDEKISYLCSFKSICSSDSLLAICLCSLRNDWSPAATGSGTDCIFDIFVGKYIKSFTDVYNLQFFRSEINLFYLKTEQARRATRPVWLKGSVWAGWVWRLYATADFTIFRNKYNLNSRNLSFSALISISKQTKFKKVKFKKIVKWTHIQIQTAILRHWKC